MQSLNKVVNEATDANEADGVVNRHAAINAAVPVILADKDMTEMCVRSHISKLIATNARNKAKERGETSCQISLFGLRDRHNIPDDPDGSLKDTLELSRIEFDAIIVVRQNQVTADIAYLTKLREARRLTGDIWDKHPDWTWGQVEAAYALLHPIAA